LYSRFIELADMLSMNVYAFPSKFSNVKTDYYVLDGIMRERADAGDRAATADTLV
jgi:hypothetical protein